MATDTKPLKLRIDSPTQLSIEDGHGRHFAIHPVWLRERCQDSESIDLSTGQRLSDPSDFDLEMTYAVSASAPDRLHVRFSDGHEADFLPADIMNEASIPPGEHDLPALELWSGDLGKLPRAEWQPTPSDSQLAAWLASFLRYGFIVFSGVPSEHHAVLAVANTFGFTRDTNFGVVFDVRSVPNPIDLAYTSLHLDPHTDNPYRSPVPGVQLLHCLTNETRGGLSTLVDGFAVGEALRARDPEAFRILSTTPVRFRYKDPTTELIASVPPIELDVSGRVRSVHVSPRLDFVPLLPPQELSAYYRARRVFDQMLRNDEFTIRFLLNDGDLAMFDNCRLLHGRTAFDPREGLRHLQGCYIDIDGPRSLYRVLRRRGVERLQHDSQIIDGRSAA